MKDLKSFEKQIRKCSKCGLCQAQCPIYKITGNDCTVSRGHFMMLTGVLEGRFKLSKTINRYLDLCLKCNKCSKFCPSGIEVVDIIASAKSEYLKTHPFEKFISFIQKIFLFEFFPNLLKIFHPNKKSNSFEKKVLYFGGCASKLKGDSSVIKLLNNIEIEVINPNFSCCGVPLFVRGDLQGFEKSILNYIKLLKKYNITEVVTTCASCEKSLKDYSRWIEDKELKEFLSNVVVKNIYEYLKDVSFKLKKEETVTFHKPCNINNYEDIISLLNSTENLKYIEMKDFDKCCGLNGISKINEYNILKKIFKTKRQNIIDSKTKNVLTSCLGCETALKSYSLGKYKVYDVIDFVAKKIDD